MNHFVKVRDVKINTKLSAEDAYNTAKKYQELNGIGGTIPKNIEEAVYLDERNYITNGITWMIRSKLEPNTFEGMDELTIVVLDECDQVYSVLDHNGIPITADKEALYSDEEFYELFDEDEII